MFASDDMVVERILTGDFTDNSDLLEQIYSWPPTRRDSFIQSMLPHPIGRRWVRGTLLPSMPSAELSTLARRLLSFEEDFSVGHRDSTTSQVIRALPASDLVESATFFAGSNAADPFWRRIAAERRDDVPRVALDVISNGDATARETTLSILLLDPYSDVRLNGRERAEVLTRALDDPDESVRGIAAEVLADEDPERLSERHDRLAFDPSERVRMAAWDASFSTNFEIAQDAALAIAFDESVPIGPRRTAVAALSAVLDTDEIAPLLQFLLAHPNPVLAEDAVNMLWAYHRTPAIAMAAAESPHESVREVAQRLLHPETGSPAAGGSRPGAPDPGRDIYREMLKEYERRDDE